MAPRGILVGAGSWGEWWCDQFLPPNIADGTLEIVAAVDLDPTALARAGRKLGLDGSRLFADAAAAFAAVPADFCIVVVPPAHHEAVVDAAVAHGLHILSEKPIADTLEASVRIAEKVCRAGLKMGVTMSHRFDADKRTLLQTIHSGDHGPLDYLLCRFTCDARKFGSWGEFRHQIPNALLVEGAVHHLDLLADMAGAPCETLYAQTWRPDWAEYAGDCQALITMRFQNGRRAVYEGAKANAVSLNPWGNEYIRAECRDATLVLDRRELTLHRHDPTAQWRLAGPDTAQPLPLMQQPKWANTWLADQFVRWLQGGPPMETRVEANLQSVALVAAAIRSAQENRPVAVQALLEETRQKTLASMQ